MPTSSDSMRFRLDDLEINSDVIFTSGFLDILFESKFLSKPDIDIAMSIYDFSSGAAALLGLFIILFGARHFEISPILSLIVPKSI